MATIFELIRRDHDSIRRLFREAREAPSDQGTVACQGRLARAIRVHDEAEHGSLYSALLARERGEDLGTEGAEAHRHIEVALDDLIATRPGTVEHGVRLQELRNQMEHHFQWEQERLFPAAHFLFGPQTLEQLGEIYRRARQDARRLAA